MKRFSRTAPELLVLCSLVVIVLVGIHTPANAMIACPLQSDQSATYTCGCNPPRLETTEPADPVKECYPAPCPVANTTVQPQSTVCPCPTYCRADGDTGSAATSPASTGTTIPSAVAQFSTDQLATCRKVSARVNLTLKRIIQTSQTQLDQFSSIASKAEDYYTQSKATFTGYPVLVQAVSDARQVAQAQLSALQQSGSAGLACDSVSPKATAAADLTDAKATIAALQAYQVAVENLLTGIASATTRSR